MSRVIPPFYTEITSFAAKIERIFLNGGRSSNVSSQETYKYQRSDCIGVVSPGDACPFLAGVSSEHVGGEQDGEKQELHRQRALASDTARVRNGAAEVVRGFGNTTLSRRDIYTRGHGPRSQT